MKNTNMCCVASLENKPIEEIEIYRLEKNHFKFSAFHKTKRGRRELIPLRISI